MIYHDSIMQADEKMAQSARQLQYWNIPATPINYAVVYAFISEQNLALKAAIDEQLSIHETVDEYFLEAMYRQYIYQEHNLQISIVNELNQVLSAVEEKSDQAIHLIDVLTTTLDNSLDALQKGDSASTTVVKELSKEAQRVKTQQQTLSDTLLASEQKTSTITNVLNKIHTAAANDALTGLLHRKALLEHLEQWKTKDILSVAGIVVKVDDFVNIKESVGSKISNLLLSKTANKVSSFVDVSGVVFRTADHEFLILLPEIESFIATDLAEKIQQGVEKLKFISSKSSVRLPKLTVSLGVNEFTLDNHIENVIQQTRHQMSVKSKNENNTITSVEITMVDSNSDEVNHTDITADTSSAIQSSALNPEKVVQ